MPVVLRDVPSGFHWGWYSREDPRMHLQTVDKLHKNLYKVWLEEKGKRTFLPIDEIEKKVLKALQKEVQTKRDVIEAQWTGLMIAQGWLTYKLNGTLMTLIAYPNTPNRFERTVELAPHLGEEGTKHFKPTDVRLNSEFAVIELWPHLPETRRPFIQIPPLLWKGHG